MDRGKEGLKDVTPSSDAGALTGIASIDKRDFVGKIESPQNEAETATLTMHDPTDPLTWSSARRWSMVILLIVTNFVAALYSSAFEPALPYIMETFNFTSGSLATLTISIYVVGYVFGPPLVAPLAEHYGRAPVLHAAWVLYLVALAVCGSSNSLALFIVFRALMGFAGLAFVILGPAIVADVIPKERRGLALSAMSAGPVTGPTLGPLIGGFVVQALQWRWIFWIGMIAMGFTWIVALVMLRETYAPVLKAKAGARRWEDMPVHREANQPTSDIEKQKPSESKSEVNAKAEELTPRQKLRRAWVRPAKMLFRSPIVMLVALYSSILNSYATVCFATVGTVFQDRYGFRPGASGLAYLGLTAGFVFCQLTLGKFSDRHLRWMERRHGGAQKPEFRLPPMFIGAVSLPLGFLWYGWALQAGAHWIVPIVGSAFIALGVLYGWLPIQMYLVDAYTTYAASATGAATIVRSVITATLPLAANPLYARLGYGWGNSVLAFIALAFVPFAFFLYRYGERIRTNPRFQPNL